MKWNKHLNLEGTHAYLGASQYHWINYSDDKMYEVYKNFLAKQKGTRLHEFASECIKLGQKLPKTSKTLNMFVNDAIGYKMQSEQLLYYSINCYGTADAISFRKRILRVHDLKTGKSQTHMEQLYVYVALFCLEYDMIPSDMEDIICCIYQNDEVWEEHPDSDIIVHIMDKIKTFDRLINSVREEENL